MSNLVVLFKKACAFIRPAPIHPPCATFAKNTEDVSRGKLSSVVWRLSFISLLAFVLTLVFPGQAVSQIFKIKRVQTTDASATKLTREQCLERARAHRINTDLQGAKLNDADLSKVVLLSADMREANLKKTILSKAVLCRANLSIADMEGVMLDDADLSGATLVNAKLKGANLVRAKLWDVSLMGADLTGAILTEADLSRANLTGAILTGAIFTKANLSDANLQGALVSISNLLDKAVLSRTILPDGKVYPSAD